MKIIGLGVDGSGRCIHYHKPFDIAALECGTCHHYFACYKCHDELMGHEFTPMSKEGTYPVMCGLCGKKLTYAQYREWYCPYCQQMFNPNCALHTEVYFKD